MNTIKSQLLSLCAAMLCMSAAAQGVVVRTAGFFDTTFTGYIVDSLTRESLPSAVISVVTKQDDGTAVRNYVADAKGYFEFKSSTRFRHRMEVSVLGYKLKLIYLPTDEPEWNLGAIAMSQSTEKIDEVVVKARLQMYKMKGDTVVYMPRAVATMKDDAVSEILRHMPGVEVSESGAVTILGQAVERTYVNHKLLFGDDPTVAIKQLEAKEVASIQSYDEVDEQDAILNGKSARKRKVLNLITFKEFTQSMHAKLRGEAGTDFSNQVDGERPARYAASGDVGYYGESMQVAINGQTNNLTMTEGVQGFPLFAQRTSKTNASISGKVGMAHKYNVGYGYKNAMSKTLKTQTIDYFPTADITSQCTQDTTRNESNSSGHTLIAGYSYLGQGGSFNTNVGAGISNMRDRRAYATHTSREGAPLSVNDRNTSTRGDSRFLNWSVDGTRQFKNGNSLSVGGKINFDDKTTRGTYLERRIDNASPFVRNQDLYAPAPGNTYEARLNYVFNFEDTGNLSFSSGMMYLTRMGQKLYTDAQTGVLDWVRSEHALDKTMTWSTRSAYFLRRGDALFHAALSYNLENRTYEDQKFGTTIQRQFHYVTGMLSYGVYKPKKNFLITLTNDHKPVPGPDFSSRIDDSNPLFISVGNIALLPTKNYSLWLQGEHLHRQNSFGYNVSFIVTTDPIIRHYTYYKEATVLPQYNNYVIPAGATFSQSDNGAAYLAFRIGGTYKKRISPLRLFLVLGAEYQYSNPQRVLNDRKGRLNDHAGKLTVDLTTNFSSRLRIGLKNTIGFNTQSGLGVSSHEIREQIAAQLQWDIVHNLFFSANYVGIFCFASHNNTLPSNHLLNVSLGYRLLKERARIAFNAYDLLNSYSPVSIFQGIQSITTQISRAGSNYFTLSFEYKFNNRKSAN